MFGSTHDRSREIFDRVQRRLDGLDKSTDDDFYDFVFNAVVKSETSGYDKGVGDTEKKSSELVVVIMLFTNAVNKYLSERSESLSRFAKAIEFIDEHTVLGKDRE